MFFCGENHTNFGSLRQEIADPSGRAAWVCGRSLAGIVDSNSDAGMDVCLVSVVCYQVEASCVGLTIRLEESYRMWCV
jgi:hypothetical protein